MTSNISKTLLSTTTIIESICNQVTEIKINNPIEIEQHNDDLTVNAPCNSPATRERSPTS